MSAIEGPMKTPSRHRRGSALLLAIILALLLFGVGGAFLSLTLGQNKSQSGLMRADEALLICDGALEKVRRALFVYRHNQIWDWRSINKYCSQITLTSPQAIKADFLARAVTPPFAAYYTQLNQSYQAQAGTSLSPVLGVNTANEAPPPPTPSDTPGTDDWVTNGIFLGWNVPFLNGAFHALVRNNDESATNPGYSADPFKDTDGKVIVTITATLIDGTQRQIEAVVFYIDPKASATFPGAIVANTDVDMKGNITVDGRDYLEDGSGLNPNGTNGTSGVFGIVSRTAIAMGGSSASGGNGTAPPGKGASANSLAPAYNFSGGFPAGPDEALGLSPGTLKSAAQQNGTYFASQADYAAYLGANGGKMPGGQIIYLEADTSPPFELGGTMNVQPSILIVHNSTSSTSVKNIHGDFKGIFFADAVDHVNAGTDILGAMMAFSTVPGGNAFGNGNSTVRYSSAVLGDLPSVGPGTAKILSWRRIV
jgi:hypothetical protein